MELIDIVIIAVIVAIVGFVIWYLRREKKRGAKCIGCPSGGNCCNCMANKTSE